MKKPILLPYQQDWVNDRSARKIWLAARQIGKSFALSMEAVIEALGSRCNNLVLSSSERQSRESMQKVFSHLRVLEVASREIVQAESATKGEVQLPNGSRIISLPANPDTVRGFSGNVFLDEFAFHQDAESIWRAMYPTVTRGYKVRVCSTANGKSNMFYRLWSEGGFSRHQTSIYEAAGGGLDLDIDALRRGIADPEAWAQEYECRFIDEATAFITYEMITGCEDENATKDWVGAGPRACPANGQMRPESGQPQGVAPTTAGEFYLGMDVARKGDLTVFWLWEKIGDVFWTRMVKEMRNTSFAAQRDFLYGLLGGETGRGNPAPTANDGLMPLRRGAVSAPAVHIRRCCIDSTGIGAQMAEEAIEKFGPIVEAVLFTQKVKEDLAITLRRKFEERQVRIPSDREIREDFHSVRKFATSAGNMRFDAERTERGHADRFWAAALGLHAGSGPRPGGVMEFEVPGNSGRSFLGMRGFMGANAGRKTGGF